MRIQEAQREFRSVYLGGAVGQFVTGAVWLLSAALSTWVGRGVGIVALFVGGVFIFPITQLALRLLGRNQTVSPQNPFNQYFLHGVIAMGATYPPGLRRHSLPHELVLSGVHAGHRGALHGLHNVLWQEPLWRSGGDSHCRGHCPGDVASGRVHRWRLADRRGSYRLCPGHLAHGSARDQATGPIVKWRSARIQMGRLPITSWHPILAIKAAVRGACL